MTPPPSDSGPRLAHLAAIALLLALLLPACGGKDRNENRIKPIQATLTIDPFAGTPDPAVYFEKVSTTGDLVTVNVKLHNGTGSTINFDTMNLEVAYDFKVIQIGDVFDVNSSLLGDCNGGTTCAPLCLNNASLSNQGDPATLDANGKAHFLLSVAAKVNSGCPSATVNSDTTLLTLGFIAVSSITAQCSTTTRSCNTNLDCPSGETCLPGSRIELISGSGTGDCEILDNLVDLGIPCVDGNATMTAAR
jgi:hypothetical protein